MPARTTSTTKALSDWFARIEQLKNFSGKVLVTYDLLPTRKRGSFVVYRPGERLHTGSPSHRDNAAHARENSMRTLRAFCLLSIVSQAIEADTHG